ncbi:MAG: hypothetical protein ACI4I2_12695 [Oscillospiraceae bacterium]|jgi:K+ transporter
MDSKSVKYVAVLLLVFAVVAAAILNSLVSAVFAGAAALSLVLMALVFIVISGILKNQETMIELTKEQNEKLAELIASKKND